jgi:hypothetical protein
VRASTSICDCPPANCLRALGIEIVTDMINFLSGMFNKVSDKL